VTEAVGYSAPLTAMTAAALKLAKRSTVTPVDDNQPTPSSAAQAARST